MVLGLRFQIKELRFKTCLYWWWARQLPCAIFCLFYCFQELLCKARNKRFIQRNKQRIIPGNSWLPNQEAFVFPNRVFSVSPNRDGTPGVPFTILRGAWGNTLFMISLKNTFSACHQTFTQYAVGSPLGVANYIYLLKVCRETKMAGKHCFRLSAIACQHLSFWAVLRLKPTVSMCLCVGISPEPTVLESCSNPQKTQQVFESAMKKKFWFWVSDFLWDWAFFGHRPKRVWNDWRKLSHFSQNVWKCRLKTFLWQVLI